jgi:CRP-like cAMP-binding protein
VLLWVKDAEENKTHGVHMTPDLKVLARLHSERVERVRNVVDNRESRSSWLDHTVSPIEKLRRSGRTMMIMSRWKGFADVNRDLRPAEEVRCTLSLHPLLQCNALIHTLSTYAQNQLAIFAEKPAQEETSTPQSPNSNRRTTGSIDTSAAKATQENMYKRLRKAPLLRNLDNEGIGRLSNVFIEKHYSAGELVMGQGEAIHEESMFYILDTGKVEILVDGVSLGIRERGFYFGEKGLLADEPRSAGIIAVTDLECSCLRRVDFEKLALLDEKIRIAFDFRLTVMAKEDNKVKVALAEEARAEVELVQRKKEDREKAEDLSAGERALLERMSHD